MDPYILYATSLSSIVVVLLLRRFSRIVLPLKILFLRNLAYPLLIRRNHWGSVTRFQAIVVTLYLAANTALISIFAIYFDLGMGATKMALINLIPLFIGGKSNPIADFLGVPLQTYYLAHHCIGRIALAQAMIHAILMLSKKSFRSDITIIASGSIINHLDFLTKVL